MSKRATLNPSSVNPCVAASPFVMQSHFGRLNYCMYVCCLSLELVSNKLDAHHLDDAFFVQYSVSTTSFFLNSMSVVVWFKIFQKIFSVRKQARCFSVLILLYDCLNNYSSYVSILQNIVFVIIILILYVLEKVFNDVCVCMCMCACMFKFYVSLIILYILSIYVKIS